MYDLLKLGQKGMKTPLAHARRFGSTHEGLHHWVWQRITAVVNLVLLVWLTVSFIHLQNTGATGFYEFLRQPMNAILMSAFIISAFNHMALGLQVVVEDYIHKNLTKLALLLFIKLVGWGGMIVALFSIAKIALRSTYVIL